MGHMRLLSLETWLEVNGVHVALLVNPGKHVYLEAPCPQALKGAVGPFQHCSWGSPCAHIQRVPEPMVVGCHPHLTSEWAVSMQESMLTEMGHHSHPKSEGLLAYRCSFSEHLWASSMLPMNTPGYMMKGGVWLMGEASMSSYYINTPTCKK